MTKPACDPQGADTTTPAPPTPPAKAIRAADRIRASARDLFYRLGIRAVGVDEIVSQAGVTKPSLYRSFPSKDALAVAYLNEYDLEFWQRFEAGAALFPDDPRGQLRHYFMTLGTRAARAGYRGCGLTNAAVEYPQQDHPARLVAEDHKQRLRTRLRAMAQEMGATDPDRLGDGLLLLIEGTFVSSQLFGAGGPAVALADVADRLIAAYLPPTLTAGRAAREEGEAG